MLTNEEWNNAYGYSDNNKQDNTQPIQQTAVKEQPKEQQEEEQNSGILHTILDTAKGIITGPVKEAENVVQAVHDVADFVDNTFTSGDNIQDDYDYDFVGETLTPDTGIGKTAQTITAFATGYVATKGIASYIQAGAKSIPILAKLASMAPKSKFVKTALQGAAVDFITGDGTDERLADVLVDNDILRNSLTEYLASDESDSWAEARFKNVLEGFLTGIALDGALKTFKTIKGIRGKTAIKAAKETGVEKAVKTITERTDAIDNIENEAERLIGEAGGVNPSLTLTKGAESKELRNSITEEVKTNKEKLKADILNPKSAINTRNYTEQAQALVDEFQKPLADAAAPLKMNMAEEGRKALAYLVDTDLYEKLDKDKLLSLYSTGNIEDMKKATAATVMYLNVFAPEQAKILLQKASEGVEGSTKELRTYIEDLFDVLMGLKRTNMTVYGQGAKLNDWKALMRNVGGENVAKETIENIPATGKELFKNMSDEDVAKTLLTFNRLIENGDAATIRSFIEALAETTDGTMNETVLDKVLRYRYFAMLSSFKTQMRNIVGNSTKIPLTAFEESVKGAVMGMRNPEHGGLVGALAGAKNGWYFLQGIKYAKKQAWENFYNSFKYNIPISRASEYTKEITKNVKSWGPLDWPTKALQACDEFFATLGGGASVYEQAMIDLEKSGVLKQNISKELANEIRNKWLDEYMSKAFGEVTVKGGKTIKGSLQYKEAIEMANELTFQQNLDKFSQSLYDVVNKYPPLKFIFPFVKTPLNIFKETLYTRGVNLPRELVKAFGEGATPQQQAQAAAHLASAAFIWISAYELYSAGRLTGSGYGRGAEGMAKNAEGWKPNSIKVGDTYLTLDAFEPFGTALSYMANLMKNIEDRQANDDYNGLDTLCAEALGTLWSVAKDKTYLKGLSSLFSQFDNDDLFSKNGAVAQYFSGFTPSVLRDLGYFADPVIRDTDTITSKVQDRIPFIREQLAPRVNWLTGNEMTTDKGLIGSFFDAFNMSTDKGDNVLYELSRLSGVDDPLKTIQGYKLTTQEYSDYCRKIGSIKLGGRTLIQSLDAVINSPLYKRSIEKYPDPSPNEIEEQRAEILRKIIRQYKETGRQLFLAENPQIMKAIRQANADNRLANAVSF